VGYRQPAQFAKAFRRHHDVSPSAYRSRSRYDGPAADPITRQAA
jgi:AraC-like DNA-binding protein